MASNASTTDEHIKDVLSAKQRPCKSIPMSPRSLSALSQTLKAAVRLCTQCKRLVPSNQKLKTCEKCRRKDREKRARKTARRKGAGDVSMKRALESVDLNDESEEEGGIGGEGWDQIRKRIKMGFGDAKRNGKFPIVKSTESKVCSSLYPPQLNPIYHFFYNRNAHPHPTTIQHLTNPNLTSSLPSLLSPHPKP